MSRYDTETHEPRPSRIYSERPSSSASSRQSAPQSAANHYVSLFVRLIGVFLLLVGLWISIKVINEAWALYRAPQHVDEFAQWIERGSNFDKLLGPIATGSDKGKDASSQKDAFHPSYFFAWAVILLLLLLIGRLALAAIKTGGELALYDLEVKRFAKTVLKEAKK